MNESNYPPGVSDNDINKYFGEDPDYEKFREHMKSWQDEYFQEWLEKDVYAYAKLLEHLGVALAIYMPSDPKELKTEKYAGRFDAILRMAKSQTYFWDQFMAWAWDRWSK